MAVAPTQDIVDTLNGLIALDFDAIAAYDAAIERLTNPSISAHLRNFRDDHERHVRELSQLVRTHGGQPRQKGDVTQILAQGMVVIRSLMGDTAILRAMKTNEDQTNATYETALTKERFPNDVRTLLQRNLEDERRHRAWIVDQLDLMQAP